MTKIQETITRRTVKGICLRKTPGVFFTPRVCLVSKYWLPIQGSNLGKRIQSPLCYHYTNRQQVMVPKVGVEPT
jgi:hypothetical protein